MSPACRGSIGAISPVWWRPRHGPSSTVYLSQRNSPVWWRPRHGPSSTMRLSWCNSPRLVAPSTWAKLNRAPLTAQVPPFGSGDVEVQGVEVAVQGGEVAVRGGVAPKVPTTSATNANNGPSRARWSAIWAQRRLASRGARKKPLNMRVNAFDTHVNLSKCAWAALPTRESAGPRADQRAHVRGVGPTCESAGPRARGCTPPLHRFRDKRKAPSS